MPCNIPFVAMSSLGNNIIIVPEGSWDADAIQNFVVHIAPLPVDQIMVLSNPMTIWNRDGSGALACGNGTRCVAALASMASAQGDDNAL